MRKIIKEGKVWNSNQNGWVYNAEGIAPTLVSGCHGGCELKIVHPLTCNMKIRIPQATKKGFIEVGDGGVFDWSYPTSKTRRGRVQQNGKVAPTLMCNQNVLYIKRMKKEGKFRIRRLTPKECFRLMDVDDENIDKIQKTGISDTQQYKLAGNSIVVSCMERIFRNLLYGSEPQEGEQLTLF